MISILHIPDVEYTKHTHNFNLIGPLVSQILIFKLLSRKLKLLVHLQTLFSIQ